MAKGFVEELVDNVIEKDDEQTTLRVPSKRENLVLRVDNDLLSKFSNGNSKLEKMLRNLLRNRSAKNKREVININKRNYKIFL